MALLEFGGAEGLAYRHNFQQDVANATELHQLRREARIDSENRLKLLGDTQYADTTKMNKWDAAQVTSQADDIQKQIGKIVAAHPNPMADPTAFLEIKRLQHSMLDNESVRIGMQNSAHVSEFNKFLATTPGSDDLPEVSMMKADLKRYEDTGTVDPTGKEKVPFRFNNPLETFDMGANLTARAKALGTKEQWDQSAYAGLGATATTVPDAEIEKEAFNIINSYPDKNKYRIAFQKLSPTEQSYYGAVSPATMEKGLHQWVKEGLKSRVDYKIDPVKLPVGRATGKTGTGSGVEGYSPFVYQIQNFPRGAVDHNDNVKELAPFVTIGDHKELTPSEPLRILLDDGKTKTWVPLTSYAGVPLQVVATGKFMNDPQGRTMLEVNGKIPLKPELSSGNVPLLKQKTWFGSSDEYDSADYEELPSTQSVLRLEHDKRPGKETKLTGYADATFWYPAATDESHKSAFDKAQLGQKEANEAVGARMMAEQLNGLKVAKDEAGNLFYVDKLGNVVAPYKP